MWIGALLIFLDFTGTVHAYLGWIAKIQFLPALLAFNFVVVAALVLLTLIFGRAYCSVICPLGVMQDIISWFGGKYKKNRFHYIKSYTKLRYAVLAAFVALMLLGIPGIALIVAPYSMFGRIAQNLFSPLALLVNRGLAGIAEHFGSYAFYDADIWIRGVSTFAIALIFFITVLILSFKYGRIYCNTVCPVGTVLGILSRFAWFRMTIDAGRCIHCRRCEKNCKSECIDSGSATIDSSRCVMCMNCVDLCKKKAISLKHRSKKTFSKKDIHEEREQKTVAANCGEKNAASLSCGMVTRRAAVCGLAALLVPGVARAQEKLTDGGLAPLKPRETPQREVASKPAGSRSVFQFNARCTGCQLCVAVCPNGVLRPGGGLRHLMQPEMAFERGFCRPECNRCSQVCPAGAIEPVSLEEKSAIQVGRAVWRRALCEPVANGMPCGNCARHCPSGAIRMVALEAESKSDEDADVLKVPVIDESRCIGCGACEYVCPARPQSAIYVEGRREHRNV